MKFHTLVLSVLCCALTAGAADTIPFTVNLSGDQVVPPITTPLTGNGLITLTETNLVVHLQMTTYFPIGEDETKITYFPWYVTIHGPAPTGSNGPALLYLGACGATNSGFTAASSGTGVITKPGNVPTTRPLPPSPPTPGRPFPPIPTTTCALENFIMVSPATREALLAGLLYIQAEGPGRIRGQILPTDSDGDGVPDYLDQCPDTPPETLVSHDGCSLDQLVPCDGAWKNHGQFVKAFKDATKSFVEHGLIMKKTKHELDKEAAHSDCGKKR